jgi:Zn-dependent protease
LTFRLGPFPVEVRQGFLVLVGVLVLFDLGAGQTLWRPLAMAAVLGVSVLVHELGHALTATALGVPTGSIVLHGLGGYVTHAATTPPRQLAISLAGPFAGFSLGLLVLLLEAGAPDHPVLQAVIGQLLWVNLGWSLFNLFPLYTLDGNQALRALVGIVASPLTAFKVAAWTGVIFGGALTLYATFQQSMFLALLCASTTWSAWGSLRALRDAERSAP